MKKIFFLTLLSVAMFSCSNDDFDPTTNKESISDSYVEVIDNNHNLNTESSLNKMMIDSLEFDTTDSSMNLIKAEYIKKGANDQIHQSNGNKTRAATSSYDGIANGKPQKTLEKQKVIIKGVTGVVSGVYFADIYTTSGQIELPTGAKDIVFDLPDVCGYVDWSTREEGVMKTTYQTKKDGVKKNYIKWSFYTIVLVYNAAGAQMWKVLPMDGAKIYLPYNFVY